MARRTPPSSDLPPEWAAAIASMSPDELRIAPGQLLDFAGARIARGLRPERVSRRRPRSAQSFSVTATVDLHGAKSKTWRRVELPSTLGLDQLHEVLQLLFGWHDSHLHRFTQGPSVWDRDVEVFLCPYGVEEGEDEGPSAAEVRLDEVLATVGDRLRDVYDYGDEWTLVVAVEQVGPPVDRPRCTGGRGTAPPEDSGGIQAWNDAPDDGEGTPFAAVLQAAEQAVDVLDAVGAYAEPTSTASWSDAVPTAAGRALARVALRSLDR